jgi:four helix bundle protein
MAPPHDLTERTRLFSLAVLEFIRRLPDTAEAREAASQLRRAANSVRANYRAARRGRSRAEFQAKLGTVFEEADECADLLAYFRDSRIRHDPALVQESRELAAIFAKAVRTARENTVRSREGEKWKK